MKRHGALFVGVGALVFASCANSGAPGGAPDWYAERKGETRRAGFPDLAAVPKEVSRKQIRDALGRTETDSAAAQVAFLSDPRSAWSNTDAESILAMADSMAGDLREREIDTTEFLTAAELAAARAAFEGREPPP